MNSRAGTIVPETDRYFTRGALDSVRCSATGAARISIWAERLPSARVELIVSAPVEAPGGASFSVRTERRVVTGTATATEDLGKSVYVTPTSP